VDASRLELDDGHMEWNCSPSWFVDVREQLQHSRQHRRLTTRRDSSAADVEIAMCAFANAKRGGGDRPMFGRGL
jgi:hypothetical protein